MRLSIQTQKLVAEGAYQVLSKANELEKKGRNIIHFEIGQPDFPTPGNISRSAIEAIKQGKTKYNPPLGIFQLREAVANHVSNSRQVDVSPNMVAITPSGKTAIFAAMAAILNPGDEVIYPDPGFPTYNTLTDFFGAQKRPVPLLEENNFSFNMEVFLKQFSSKTKLIILNSPSNPTGGVIPLEDLKTIARVVSGSNCWILTDEIYSWILYGDQVFKSIYSLPKMAQRTILVDSFSKTYSMTGWRLGYLIMPEIYIEKMDYLLTNMVGCTATFTQYAGLEALNGSQLGIKKMISEFEKRRNYLVGELNNIKGVSCQMPEGAFYVFPNIKRLKKRSSEIADYLLKEVGVSLLPGTAFGKYGEGYLRISYANSMENLKEGVRRIREAIDKI